MQPEYQFDLVVAGGGTAGSLCAIAAARNGLKTAVVEKSSCLGGMLTGAGLTEMNAAGFQGKPLYEGIEKEIFDALIEKGAGEYHFGVPMSSNKEVKVDRLRYNPEILKMILEEKACLAGITIFYESEVVEAKEEEDGCRLVIEAGEKRHEIVSAYLADGTGNARLVRKMGAKTQKSEKGQQLTSTLMFRLSNVEMEQLDQFLKSGRLADVIAEGYEKGVLKGKILAFTPIPGTRDVSLNVTRTDCDYEDAEEYAKGIAEARRQILPVCEFIKEKVPGMKDSYLSNIAPFLGVRDGRRIQGVYTLTMDDLESMRSFPDNVASGCYPMDIHDPVTKGVVWKVLPGVYHIPYRCLLPAALKRTLAVGKSLSADKKAFGAVRVMPIMMNVGESAGYLFALAKEKKVTMAELSEEDISNYLKTKYENWGKLL